MDAFQDALKEYAAVSEVTDDVNEIAKHFFLAGREHQREVDDPYMRHLSDCLGEQEYNWKGKKKEYKCTCGLNKLREGE